MGKEYPVGTTRQWQAGEVIKIDDTPATVNWIPTSVSQRVKTASREMEAKGRVIKNYREPFDGSKLFDRMLSTFYEKEMGWSKENARMVPGEMKNLGNLFGSWNYSFYNYFSKVEMAKKINEKLRKKKVVQDKAREDWENTPNPPKGKPASMNPEFLPERNISDKELNGLLGTMDNAIDVLKTGLDFEGERKDAYWGSLEEAEVWEYKYVPLPEIIAAREVMIEKFEKVFTGEHDWVVKETFDDKLEEHFKKYFDRYEDRIIQDEGVRVQEELGLDIKAPTNEFYKPLYKKGEKLSDFEVSTLLKVRLSIFLGKRLEGNWSIKNAAAVENFEKLAQTLPKGHVLNNDRVRNFKNTSYVDGHGYAHFNSGERRIAVSDEFLERTSTKGRLTDEGEFFAVVPHEIGHAVADAFEKVNPVGYRRWVSLCGWHFSQSGLKATGGDRPTARLKNEVELISQYSHMSPSEAFAEYYSCYSQNKKGIDRWLETDNMSHLSMTPHSVMEKTVRWEAKDDGGYKRIEGTEMVIRNGIVYRGEGVSVGVMQSGKKLFSFLKEAVWGSAPLNKALENELGISYEYQTEAG